MVINLNIPITLLKTLVQSVEQLATDYATVHAAELERARSRPTEEKARFFYQSDKLLYEQEMKEKLAAEGL